MSSQHLPISAISQLVLAQLGSNFKRIALGTSTTDSICHCDICPGNICPYQHYKYFQAEHFRLQSCYQCNEANLNQSKAQFSPSLVKKLSNIFCSHFFLTSFVIVHNSCSEVMYTCHLISRIFIIIYLLQ